MLNVAGKEYFTILFILHLPIQLETTQNHLTTEFPLSKPELSNFESHTNEPIRTHRLKDKVVSQSQSHMSSSFTMDRFLPGEPPDGKGPNCRRRAKCQKLHHNTCFGVKLPYSSTTLDLVDDVTTQEQVLEKLSALSEGLRQIPKCWAVIQPLLCSLYMPRCEDNMVDLPSQEMCNVTFWPCRTVLSNNNWPSFPRCENVTTFPPKCRNDVRELKFNTTGQCQAPLVQTDNSFAFYEGVEGCGIQCSEPLFTSHEQQQLYNVIGYGGSICLAVNLFTAVTFLIDWRSANKYPPLIIFYINCCFLVSCVGWLAQFMPNARQDIVCRKDGTLRMAEPSAVENLSCVIIFVLVYYPIIAALVWFVILTYAWDISFQSVGKMNDNIDKKGVYFHMAAWSIPLILTITTMALGEIDGSSVAGICFVGYINHAYRIGFLWGPILITLLVSGYFIIKVLYTLIMLKISSQDIISELATAKIQKTIVRIAVFSLFMLVLGITSFICHVYEFLNHTEWKESFRKLIVCKVTASSGLSSTHMDPKQCRLESRPSVSVFQLHLLVFFCAGIIMSSWVWTSSTVRTWKRFLRRNICSQRDEPVRMKKHKAIAQAFANWKTFNNDGRLSISFHSSHEDPVGLNLDVNSIASLDFSSTWAAALPTLMTRRGGIIGGSTTCSNTTASSYRRNSMDSEISVTFHKRVSVDKRRNSLDSQVSVQISQVTATKKTKGWCNHVREPKQKRRRRDFGRSHGSHVVPPFPFSRTESSTSQDSHLGQVCNALPFNSPLFPSLTPSIPNIPNFTRRQGITGNTGFNFPLPFSFLGQSLDLSDDSVHEAKKPVEEQIQLKEITHKHEQQQQQLLQSQGIGEEKKVENEDEEEEEEPKEDDCFLPEVIQLPPRKETPQKCGTSVRNDSGYKTGLVSEGGRKSRNSEKSRNSVENKGSKQGVLKNSDSTQEGLSRNAESEGRRSGNKRKLEEIQNYQTDDSDIEDEDTKCMKQCSLPSMDMTGLSESSSFCPELMRLMGANSGASVFTHHTLGGGRVRTVGVGPHIEYSDMAVQVSPQEIATQTSASLETLEGEAMTKTHQLLNKGVQVSPSNLPPLNYERQSIYSAAPYSEKMNVPGFDYGYTLQRLVEQIAEGNPLHLSPLQALQRNAAFKRNGYRSRSAEDKIEGYYLGI